MKLNLTEPQQELGIVAIVISFLLIVITTLHFATAPKVEAPSEPREKHPINPTFYGNQDLPKTHNHDKNKIYIYKLEQRKEMDVIKVEEKKEIASRGEEVHKSFGVEATAYTAFCDTGCVGVTRVGIDVSQTIYYKGKRIIAVDPKVVPLHSIVKVEYDDESFLAYAADTGGNIKKFRIDILVETKQEAIEFGRRMAELTIVREGKGDS
jgi:3D (Asp-Asp-Asp) domain-containing protein